MRRWRRLRKSAHKNKRRGPRGVVNDSRRNNPCTHNKTKEMDQTHAPGESRNRHRRKMEERRTRGEPRQMMLDCMLTDGFGKLKEEAQK